MNYTFAASVKVISNGRKNHYKVFCNGEKIGERKSTRSYGWALVGRKSHASELARARGSREYMVKQAARYERWLVNPMLMVSEERHSLEFANECIADGSIAKWIECSKAQAARDAARVAELESMNQESPEFAGYFIVEFSNTRRIASRVAACCYGLQFVDLPKV